MKNKELIERLQRFDPEEDVFCRYFSEDDYMTFSIWAKPINIFKHMETGQTVIYVSNSQDDQ